MRPIPAGESTRASLTSVNPVYDGYFADPFVFISGSCYYAVGTGPSPGPDFEFPLLRSWDFIHWELLSGALIRSGPSGRNYWAPEIAEFDGVFYMYYSVGSSDERHELRVATSTCAGGPYVETESPLLDPSTASFAIDPSPYRDEDGSWYLFYARDFLDSGDGNRPGTAIVMAPLVDMQYVEPGFTPVMRARHDWQRFMANRAIYEGIWDWHTLEGPCVVKHDGRYYCFYSGGNWQNDTYGIDFVVSENLCGPWLDTNPGDGARVLRTMPGRSVGPGHNSIVCDPNGRPCIAYHAWNSDLTARQLCIDPLVWSEDGPRSAALA